MKKRILFLLILTNIVFFNVVVQAQFDNPGDKIERYHQNQIFVRTYSSNLHLENWQELSSNEGHTSLDNVLKNWKVRRIEKAFPTLNTPLFNKTYRLVLKGNAPLDDLIHDLKKVSSIELAEKIPIYEISYTPNDPQISNQYSLGHIGAFTAFDTHTGGQATVAIVDDAVLLTHEDLAANIWVNPLEIPNNGIDDDNNGYIDDINGYDLADEDSNPNPPTTAASDYFSHGTHCAGIAGGVTDNNIGIASIGFNNKIVAVKTTEDNGNPRYITHGFEGVAYAIATGVDIISMSWGGTGNSSVGQDLFNLADSLNITCIAAAGNDNSSNLFYPAAYEHVISVANTDSSDGRNSSSNYGTWIDVSAPGTSILSTVAGSNSSYEYYTGTSMACPMVAGLAGLMKSYNTQFTPTEIEACLKASADNIDAQNPSFAGQLGAGRINAAQTIACIGYCPSNETVSLSAITNSPNVLTANAGTTFQFSVSSNNALSHQWTVTGEASPISTSTTASYTFNRQGIYRVNVEAFNNNVICSENSFIDIEIICPIDIAIQGSSSGQINEAMNIYNASNNSSSVSYSWYLDGNPIGTPPSSFAEIGAYTLTLEANNGICTVTDELNIVILDGNSQSFVKQIGDSRSRGLLQTLNGDYIFTYYQKILKLDHEGNTVWEKAVDASSYTNFNRAELVNIDANSILAVSSSYDGNLLFYTIDVNTAAFEPNPVEISDAGYTYFPTTIEKQGNYVYVGGIAKDTADTQNYFLLKYNLDSKTCEWLKVYEYLDFDMTQGIKATSDGNIILHGGSKVNWIALKISSIGETIWHKSYALFDTGVHGQANIQNIVEDKEGKAYYFFGRDASNTKALLIKTNTDGQILFSKRYKTTYGFAGLGMASNQNGELALFGVNAQHQPIAVGINMQGEIQWSRRYDYDKAFRHANAWEFLNQYDLRDRILPCNDGGYIIYYNTNLSSKANVLIKTDQNGLTSAGIKQVEGLEVLDYAPYYSPIVDMASYDRNYTTTTNVAYPTLAINYTEQTIVPYYSTCSAIASFNLSRQHYCGGESLELYYNAPNATSFSWSIDGDTVNPPFSNLSAGMHEINLTVGNSTCSGALTKQVYVSNMSSPSASFNYQIVPNEGEMLYAFQANNSNNSCSYNWSFNQTVFSDGVEVEHLFDEEGFVEVCLSVSNSCGTARTCQMINIVCTPTNPSITDVFASVGDAVVLSVNNTSELETINWYESINDAQAMHIGNSLSVPNVSNTQTYYVENQVDFTYTFGLNQSDYTGYIWGNDWLSCSSTTPFNLKSFDVAIKDGTSTEQKYIKLKIIDILSDYPDFETVSIPVPLGETVTVDINHTFPASTYYILPIDPDGLPEAYIEMSYLPLGETFPIQAMTNSSVFSIDGTRGYFYSDPPICPALLNWKVELKEACSSERIPVSVVLNDNCSASDSLALVAFYNATDGDNWINSWNLNAPMSTWYGVTLNENGCVSRLQFYANNYEGNNLNGSLPPELGDLSNLRVLSLVFNDGLSGSIPTELYNLTTLDTLRLRNNAIEGGLDSAIGNLTNLKLLELQRNNLSGAIPLEIENCSLLKKFYLNHNAFTGEIPFSVGNLSNLTHLSLGANQFTGEIPSSVGNLNNLELLSLFDNNLVGALPDNLMNLSSLKNMVVYNNELSGNIPPWLGNLTSLTTLELNKNQFTGALPEELCNLTNLEKLYLHSNNLEGCIPLCYDVFCGIDYTFYNNGGLPNGGGFWAFCNNNYAGSCGELFCADSQVIFGDLYTGNYQATQSLSTNNATISSGNNVQMNAGFEIEIGAGFEIEIGAEFSAEIDACSNEN